MEYVKVTTSGPHHLNRIINVDKLRNFLKDDPKFKKYIRFLNWLPANELYHSDFNRLEAEYIAKHGPLK